MSSFDVVIEGGNVFCGSGENALKADVGIVGDCICEVGDLSKDSSGLRIRAAGLSVTPGFVDIHTHSDLSALIHPQMHSMLSQGVTTQVVGNCALCLGLALDTEQFLFERRWLEAYDVRITWTDMDGHLTRVADTGIGTNYAMLAGQGTLRKRIVGLDDRPAHGYELSAMQRELEKSMAAGAWGMSTGLEYTPSRYADVDELAALSSVVAQAGGIYTSHLRNEGDTLEEAVEEALEIGRRAHVPVQLSHHKAEGRANWGKVQRTLKMVDAAVAAGNDVQLDQYPYRAFQTSLSVQFFPAWMTSGSNDELLERLRDETVYSRAITELKEAHPEWDSLDSDSPWNLVEIGMSRSARELQGRKIADIAVEWGMGPIETVFKIVQEAQNFVSAVNFAICEDDIAAVMRHPLTMIGSDAVGTSPYGKLGEDRVHPRSYGTFPRILGRYVRELGVLTEQEAVRKMTSLPATRLGLDKRGRIAPGWYADIVVYNPSTVTDCATFESPHQFSKGIECVLVNGTVAWNASGPTDALTGRVLRKQAR